jgi:hypothetical protein
MEKLQEAWWWCGALILLHSWVDKNFFNLLSLAGIDTFMDPVIVCPLSLITKYVVTATLIEPWPLPSCDQFTPDFNDTYVFER